MGNRARSNASPARNGELHSEAVLRGREGEAPSRYSPGAGAAKTVRSVLNGVMGYAIRADALTSNPVRDVERIGTQRRRVARALSEDERHRWVEPWRPTRSRC